MTFRDNSNNFVGLASNVSWSNSNPIVGTLSGATGSHVIFTPSVFGTTKITATDPVLIDDSTGLLIIGVGPATQISIEDRNDGTGVNPIIFDLVQGGDPRRGYAIMRDAGGNFVNNSTS